MERYIVMSFRSTHDAIKGENEIKKENIEARLIPLPPEVSAGCGLALRMDPSDRERIADLFTVHSINVESIFEMTREDGKRKVVRLDG